jgi:uncharacterized cupin superfamily protein
MANNTSSAPISVFSTGPIAHLTRSHPDGLMGKQFLSMPLGLTGCEISINRLAAGVGTPFRHKHKRNEEIYIITSGQGVMIADGQTIPLAEGTSIRFSPAVDRALVAADDSALEYICIQTPEGGMPYTFMDDGVITGTDVPFKRTYTMPGFK